jgi:Flp pilus assembly protein TadG
MKILNRFKKDVRGATAVIFGLAVIPVIGFAGAAIDYSRATNVQSSLQKGVDGAALQLAQRSKEFSDGELQARGQQLVASIADSQSNLQISSVLIVRDEDKIRVSANAVVSNAFMGLFGINTTPVSAESSATSGNKTIELALVLDNTWSMRYLNRLPSLKTASRNLLSALRDAAPDDETIRVSIIPFDQRVRVDADANRYAPWISFASESQRKGWRGFIEDRDFPYDVSAAPVVLNNPATLFPASDVSEKLATVLPLMSAKADYSTLRNKIDSMEWTTCTNITIGAAWGLDSLLPGGQLPGAKPVDTDGLEKIMILLTDGDNTRSRAEQPKDNCAGTASVAINVRTKLVCEEIKKAGITLYTVRLTAGNAALLQACASKGVTGAPLYFDVTEASQLDSVFQEIVNRILSTRLTN